MNKIKARVFDVYNDQQKINAWIDYGGDIKQTKLAAINVLIDEKQLYKQEVESQLLVLRAELSAIENELKIAIISKQPPDTIKEIEKRLNSARVRVAVFNSVLAQTKIEIVSLQKEYNVIYNVPTQERVDLHLLEYNEDIGATINADQYILGIPIENERGHFVTDLSLPSPDVEYPRFVPYLLQDSKAAFYNAAVFAGLQKDRPFHRTGSIYNIDYQAATCDVDLEQATSTAQNLNINKVYTLTNVPIDYSCVGAFDDRDYVVVEFQDNDWEQPSVIGFKRDAKPCPIFYAAVPLTAAYSFFALPDPSPLPTEDRRACYNVLLLASFDTPKVFTKEEYEAGLTLQDIIDAPVTPPENTQTIKVLFSKTLYNNAPAAGILPPPSYNISSIGVTANSITDPTQLVFNGQDARYNTQLISSSDNYQTTTVNNTGAFVGTLLTSTISDYEQTSGKVFTPSEFLEYIPSTPSASFTYLSGDPQQRGSATVTPLGFVMVKYEA